MAQDELRNEFLDKLYAAAVGAEDWKTVLAAYVELIGGHAGLINYYDVPNGRIRTVEWHNFDQQHIADSDAYWQKRDPWSAAGSRQVAQAPHLVMGGLASRGSDLLPQAELFRSEWYNEFASKSLVQDCLGTVGVSGELRGLALIANTGGRPPRAYTDDKLALADSLRSDIQRAVDMHVRNSEGNQMLLAAQGHLQLRLPVFALRDRQVLTANAAAMQEAERGRLVRMYRDKVYAQDPELDRLLLSMSRLGKPHATVVVTASDGSRHLAQALRFNRLRGTLMDAAGVDDPAVILVLTSLDDGAAGRDEALKALTVFTPVEQAIAAALVNGQSVEEIARDRQASVQTIRWHLRNMTSKLGESGLKGLTRVLTLLLPY